MESQCPNPECLAPSSYIQPNGSCGLCGTDRSRQGKGTHTYAWHRDVRRSRLSATAKNVAGALLVYMSPEGTCFPSYLGLVKHTSLSRSTIALGLLELKKAGWITWASGKKGHEKNRYQMRWPGGEPW